jgi:hypothetical protein
MGGGGGTPATASRDGEMVDGPASTPRLATPDRERVCLRLTSARSGAARPAIDGPHEVVRAPPGSPRRCRSSPRCSPTPRCPWRRPGGTAPRPRRGRLARAGRPRGCGRRARIPRRTTGSRLRQRSAQARCARDPSVSMSPSATAIATRPATPVACLPSTGRDRSTAVCLTYERWLRTTTRPGQRTRLRRDQAERRRTGGLFTPRL